MKSTATCITFLALCGILALPAAADEGMWPPHQLPELAGRLSEMGLPTPNLSSGQHSPHSRLEWACLDEMVLTVRWLVELCKVWAETTEP